jgi:hypothetical protein
MNHTATSQYHFTFFRFRVVWHELILDFYSNNQKKEGDRGMTVTSVFHVNLVLNSMEKSICLSCMCGACVPLCSQWI